MQQKSGSLPDFFSSTNFSKEIRDGIHRACAVHLNFVNMYFLEMLITKGLDWLLKDYHDLWTPSNQYRVSNEDYEKSFLHGVFSAIVFAPIMEEVVFRGLITPILRSILEHIGIKQESLALCLV